jgi:hypothetical protein
MRPDKIALMSEYMLSATPQVRSELVENDFLYSDRGGVLTWSPLTFKPVGDIQNKLLSEKRTALAAIEDNGVFTIWTGEFDTNGMPTKEKKIVFSSVQALNNGNDIGPNKKPYKIGFAENKLAIYALGQGGKNVGTLAITPSYTIGSSIKIKLMDNGALNLYIGDALFWSTILVDIAISSPPPTTTPPNTNPLIGPGTSNPNATPQNSNYTTPLLIAGALFAAYKFLK